MTAITHARGIMAALSVLQGTCAVGTLLVHSTGATGTVPAHSHAVPVVGGVIDEDALLRVSKNPATTDGSWPVTSAGVAVPVSAVQGGTRGNLAAGTSCLWDPPIAGIESQSATVAGIAGGTWLDAFGALKQVKEYRELDRDAAISLFRAQAVDTPAAVLAWLASTPVAGSVSAGYGPSAGQAGRGVRLFKHEWALFLVTTRMGALVERLREGATLRDDVLDVLTETTAVRGQVLSSPQGIEILEARQYGTTPTSFVDIVRFATSYALSRRASGAAYSDWLKSRYRGFYAAGTHPAAVDVPDITIPMT